MSKIEQKAGRVGITIYTDGWPRFPIVKLCSLNGSGHEVNVEVGDLHDLRYCIDRTLAQLAEEDARVKERETRR